VVVAKNKCTALSISAFIEAQKLPQGQLLTILLPNLDVSTVSDQCIEKCTVVGRGVC
jgi:hypothetical protein